MWIGFNSNISIDNSEIQAVDYLPPINLSPTSYSVVHETMKLSQKIANECGQRQIIVSYDLAIAKMAMQIQMTESPKFDNIFINLGAFHIQMAFFKAIGKYIDSSGITDILVDAQVLDGGSVNGFLTSKHFNRCKRIHPLLSAALQSLLIESFLSENEVDPSILIEDLKFMTKNSVECTKPLNLPDALQDTIKKYQIFVQNILSGYRGKTAQYYLQYIELINLYFRFSRSIRTNDFDLYVDCLYDIANLFFAFNQQNYARWILKYYSNLIELKSSNSKLFHDFKRGAFGIKRTRGILARSPVDLTLEQTINADAASSLTGVTHFSNSISARQRWALSHSMRTKIITKVFDELNMTSRDDTIRELEPSRIEKDRKAVVDISNKIKENINPFDSNIDPNFLFNIVTGRAVSDETAEFLIDARQIGERKKIKFIEDCNLDSDRFETAISKHQIKNFASECIKKTFKSRDGNKQILMKMERDIFGRLLAIALDRKIDIELCLSYPLAPAPPALCQCTGEMHKTDKSVLAKKIKKFVEPEVPPHIDVEFIDGFYFLHRLGPAVPEKFDKVAEFILRKICNSSASEIHIIFDQYASPSIKDLERINRHEIDIPYTIIGPSQSRPNDFLKSLKNKKFKEALVQFLSQQWQHEDMVSILGTKKVYITVGRKCYSFSSQHQEVFKTEETRFECSHEEADTRIIYHLNKCERNSKIMIKASDTDVIIILLGNIFKFIDLEIWLLSSGTNVADSNCINCTALANELGRNLCNSLPGFHAFTGCDYTASFYRKGKAKPFEILRKNEKMQLVFASLNHPKDIEDEDKIKLIQEFTCSIYGFKNCCSVDYGRLLSFEKLFATQSLAEEFIRNIKNFDSSLMPPCWKSLKQKILRCIYVTSMWQNATDKNCVLFDIEECGWICDNNNIEPLWFEGDPTPLLVEDIVLDDNYDDDKENEEDLSRINIDSDEDE